MLFQTIDFAVFFTIVFSIYWLLQKKKLNYQNFFLIVSSYVFYGWWDVRFLILIFFSSFVDFFVGLMIGEAKKQKTKKKLLLISLFFNLTLLGVFKYFNFFIDNFVEAFSMFGEKISFSRLEIILPVGISFYTFQTLSYTIDIYRGKLKPSKNIFAFFAYVSFFPQLVAGPIERATSFLPQFLKKREFNYLKAVDGMRQILWGLFKKIVIADTCALHVDEIFGNYGNYSGSVLIFGAVLFSFQIYGDFSGYSDIAIGTSRLFGFNLSKNFSYPYFSRDIAEFWRRWHISLSTWFRDYIYIPLGGSKSTIFKSLRNIFIVFTLSGFWHGANWTFVFWGGLNALYFSPLLIMKKNRKNIEIVAINKVFPKLKELTQIITTFSLVTIGWIFFRSKSVNDSLVYLSKIKEGPILKIPYFLENTSGNMIFPSSLIILLIVFNMVEWAGRKNEHALQKLTDKLPKPLRLLTYVSILILVFWFSGKENQFIYFQF